MALKLTISSAMTSKTKKSLVVNQGQWPKGTYVHTAHPLSPHRSWMDVYVWFPRFLVIGLVKKIGGDATCAYLGMVNKLTMYRDLVKYRLSTRIRTACTSTAVRPHAIISDRYHPPPNEMGARSGLECHFDLCTMRTPLSMGWRFGPKR